MDHLNDAKELGMRWITFRPQIRILDCTIRDGGLMNDHNFTDEVVKAVYGACVAGGIDGMEMGYKGDRGIFSPDTHGAWKFCSEDDLRRIVDDNPSGLLLSAMADVGRTDYHRDILPKADSVLGMIRVACYIHQVPAALDMVKDAHDKGYETCINLMSLSTVPENELEGALELFAKSEAEAMYVVDSFGSLFTEQVRFYVNKFLTVAQTTGKTVGMHAHNNQQMAFANTIEALILGANLLDSSLAGLGRGAGNCPTEYLVGFLRNPKYSMRPLLEAIQKAIEPLRSQFYWGPHIAYMLTGMLNRHPRDAMDFCESPTRDQIVAFYDKLMT